MLALLFRIFLCSLPFVHAFAFTDTVNLTIVVGVVLLILLPFSRNRTFRPSLIDAVIPVYIFTIVLSDVMNISILSIRTINHTLAWNVCLLLFFYIPRLYIKSVSAHTFFKIITGTYILVSAFAVLEFLSANVAGVDFNDYIPRPWAQDYVAGFMGGLLRSRAFFTESGYAGMYMALIYPFALYWFTRNGKGRWQNILLFILTLFAAFTIFSTTYIMFYPMVISTVFLICKQNVRRGVLKFLPVVILGCLVLGDTIVSFGQQSILYKFGTNSAYERYYYIMESLELYAKSDISHLLLGYGAGSYAALGLPAAASVYVNVLRDSGIIGLAAFCTIWVIAFREVYLHRANNFAPYLLVSLIMTSIYFVTNLDYNFVFMWFLPAMAMNIGYFELKS